MTNPRKRRLTGAVALTTILVAVFAALGGVGVAQSAISAAQYQYGKKKVTICHKGKKTIKVGERAAATHLRKHHDKLGACAKAKHKKHKQHHKPKKHDSKGADPKSEHAKPKVESKDKVKVESKDKVKKTDDKKSEARESDKPGHGKGKGRGK